MKSRLKIKLVLILAFFFPHLSQAQQDFMFSAGVKPVPSDGFYRINLNPFLIAKSKGDLSDVRIVDKKGKYVPYVSDASLPKTGAEFRAFRILNSTESDSTTTVVIENGETEVINRLWLNLKNANVVRKADLAGSDDARKWFALEEDFVLYQNNQLAQDDHYQALSFPASRYRYYKLVVYNNQKSPLNLLRVGVFKNYSPEPTFTELPLKWTIRDSSDRNSYVSMIFNGSYKVDKLIFTISKPRYYKREIIVYGRVGGRFTEITEAVLSSDKKNEVTFSAKNREFKVRISNGDNPELTLTNVKAFSLNTSLLAYLEKGNEYQILTGNPKASTPDYDLQYFTDSALSKVQDASHLPIQQNAQFKRTAKKAGRDWSIALWSALGVAILSLLLLSGKMLKEIDLGKKG